MTAVAAGLHTDARPGFGHTVSRGLIVATLTFNFCLAFVNASITPLGAAPVIGIELLLIAIAGLMIWTRSATVLVVATVVICWLAFEMLMRYQFDAKTFRDGFIPIVFFFLGRYCSSPASGDRLVTACIIIVAAGAAFEWLFLDAFLRYFDVLGYFQAKGSLAVDGVSEGPGLFVSGLRFEGRTLLPILGEHRVSSVFLEPVSLGNFGAIAFAWVLLRDRKHPARLLIKSLAILMILVLGDARFGLYLCGLVICCYLLAPLMRPTMIFVVPFLFVLALLGYASTRIGQPWDNTTSGRFLFSGQLLSTLDLAQAFGIKASGINYDDSGYSYMLSQFGIPGAAGLWALYVYGAPASTLESWRFKLFVCLYLAMLLSISTSSVTIKTAALLWFLAGSIAIGDVPAPRSLSRVTSPRGSGAAPGAAQPENA